MIESSNSFKLRKSQNIKFEICFFAILILILLLLGLIANIKYYEFKKDREDLMDALDYCGKIYTKATIQDYTDLKAVNKCKKLLDDSIEDQLKYIMLDEINEAEKYILLKNKLNSYFKDAILISNINTEDIETIYRDFYRLKDKYQLTLLYLMEEMELQNNKINLLITRVNNMYETNEKINIRQDLTRIEYEQSLEAYNEIKQENIKNEYIKYINEANDYLVYKEKLEEERKRQREIQNAWIKMYVPYISQNLNNVFNGCEAASMLMGLKYKGYLSNMDLVTFASNMPKSSDPNTGFYLDIFGKYPNTEAHWIAPAPLVEYTKSQSGNSNIINATGWDISSITNEIINYNPVVIYLTYDFLEPYNWSKGVPKNLHVLLITGYNKITNQYIITDPYTRSNGTYEFILHKNSLERLYNLIGKRAVIIR